MEDWDPGWSVSIHAPRAGGDVDLSADANGVVVVSIHAPRAGGDGSLVDPGTAGTLFQSTPPAQGATLFIL